MIFPTGNQWEVPAHMKHTNFCQALVGRNATIAHLFQSRSGFQKLSSYHIGIYQWGACKYLSFVVDVETTSIFVCLLMTNGLGRNISYQTTPAKLQANGLLDSEIVQYATRNAELPHSTLTVM